VRSQWSVSGSGTECADDTRRKRLGKGMFLFGWMIDCVGVRHTEEAIGKGMFLFGWMIDCVGVT
jgi:hypothetical protein